MNFLSFLFYQYTALSSRAVELDGHQMYFGGSVVGKASTIDPEISPTTFLNFTGGISIVPSLPFLLFLSPPFLPFSFLFPPPLEVAPQTHS